MVFSAASKSSTGDDPVISLESLFYSHRLVEFYVEAFLCLFGFICISSHTIFIVGMLYLLLPKEFMKADSRNKHLCSQPATPNCRTCSAMFLIFSKGLCGAWPLFMYLGPFRVSPAATAYRASNPPPVLQPDEFSVFGFKLLKKLRGKR